MSFRPLLVSVATLAFASSVTFVASADECTGWFCDETPKAPDGDAKDDSKPGDLGTATIPGLDGGILSGTITEIVPGDHLTLKLPNGELKTLKWGELLQLQISGKIVIGGGVSAPPPPPKAPPPPATVVIAPPPPKYVSPPPPPTSVYAPPDDSDGESVAPHDSFKERWTLGLGLSLMSPNDRATFVKRGPLLKDYVGSGTGFEASLGYRFSPSWTTYGFYEYARYRTGPQNGDVDNSTKSSLLGLGLRANTNPDGPLGFFFDMGFGYRWMTVPGAASAITGGTRAAGDAELAGWEYLRLGAGLSLNSSKHVRWHVAVVGSAGSFSKLKQPSGGCVGGGSDSCEDIPEDSRGSYAFGGLTFGGQFDL